MLSEISLTTKTICCISPLIENNQFLELENQELREDAIRERLLIALHLFWRDENILEQDSGGVA